MTSATINIQKKQIHLVECFVVWGKIVAIFLQNVEILLDQKFH